ATMPETNAMAQVFEDLAKRKEKRAAYRLLAKKKVLPRGEGSIPVPSMFDEGDTSKRPESPLDLNIVEIDMRLARDLNSRWHSMVPRTDLGNLLCGNMSVAYAAEYEGRYFAVAILSQPINRAHCDGDTIELRRLAICWEAPRNTASRMLSVVCKRLRKTRR